MQVGDLVRHNHYGYTGVLVGYCPVSNMRRVFTRGDIKLWLIEDIEVIHESR
jgi:hypothetical protein